MRAGFAACRKLPAQVFALREAQESFRNFGGVEGRDQESGIASHFR